MPRIKRVEIALDTETTGIDLRFGARPFLVTIFDGEETTFWEWAVDPLTRKPIVPKSDLMEIQDWIERADRIVCQNIKFDFVAMRLLFEDHGMRMRWDWSKSDDTLISGHLLASNQPHDLTSMSLYYLGADILPYEEAVKKACNEARRIARSKYPTWRIASKDLPEMPSAKESVSKFDMWLPREIAKAEGYESDHPWWTVTSDYANADSAVTLPLHRAHMELIKERRLEAIYKERLKLLPIVCQVEDRGVTVSSDRLEELRERFIEESEASGKTCVNIAKSFGFDLSLPKSGNNKSLTEFVFDHLGMKPLKTSKKTGNPSLDKGTLDVWETDVEPNSKAGVFIRSLKGKRKRDTAVSYTENYQRFWHPYSVRMKVFPDWFVLNPSMNATGTDTLRWSIGNPNTANVSKDENFSLRPIFGPAPGREWWAFDYENIELRIPAYESNERVMVELFEKPDEPPYFGSYHLMNASIIYPDLFWPLADEKGAFKKKYAATWYQWVKNFGFAFSYGCQEETGDRAAHKKGSYNLVKEKLKEHSKLNQKYIDYANRFGYVETLPDKTVDPTKGYPILCSRSSWGDISPTIPLNFHVQSTAMWCTMKAMIRCQEYLNTLRGYYMILQVHDELVFDFPKGDNRKHVAKIKQLMEKSGEDIGIPLRVSPNWHPVHWGQSETPE